MELWDVYDINRNKTGKIIDRHSNQLLVEGEYHLGAEAIILNSQKSILISRRSKLKNKYPLLWECNGGSVKSGETSIQGIIRELKEKLGLQFDENDAIFYKSVINDETKIIKDIWVFHKDIDIDKLCFVDKEVVDAMWVSIDKLEDMKEKNIMVPRLFLTKEEFKKILSLIDNI